MALPLEQKFKKAVWLIRNGPAKAGTSNEEKLKFYSLYKQAIEGDCTGAQPWAVQVGIGQAKKSSQPRPSEVGCLRFFLNMLIARR